MKQDLDNCPSCQSELEEKEKELRLCHWCNVHWDENNKIEEEESEPEDRKSDDFKHYVADLRNDEKLNEPRP